MIDSGSAGRRVRTQGRERHRVAVPMHCRELNRGKAVGLRTSSAPNIAGASLVAETKVPKGPDALRFRAVGFGNRAAGWI
jgi:hypothetical protein